MKIGFNPVLPSFSARNSQSPNVNLSSTRLLSGEIVSFGIKVDTFKKALAAFVDAERFLPRLQEEVAGCFAGIENKSQLVKPLTEAMGKTSGVKQKFLGSLLDKAQGKASRILTDKYR